MTRKLEDTYEKWGLDINLNKAKYLCNGGTHSNLKLDEDNEIEFCQEYKYLGGIFDTSETDDEIRSRVIQARKCVASLNGILWSKDMRKERKLNIYNALIKSILLCGSETWRRTENKRRVEAADMGALRRFSRISGKDRFRTVTVRQQIGLEKTIIKEIEQNQLTWYGHVRRMAGGGLSKIALKWMSKQKRAGGRPKKNWMEEGHERKKPKLRPVGREEAVESRCRTA